MSAWEEVKTKVKRCGGLVDAEIRFLAGDECRVLIDVRDRPIVTGVGFDLFEALAAARLEVELDSGLICCNGSRVNVYPSEMLRQATQGRRAYVLKYPRTPQRVPSVDIFDATDAVDELGTVAQQRAWFDKWRGATERT